MTRDSGAPLYEFFAGGGFARLGLEPDFAGLAGARSRLGLFRVVVVSSKTQQHRVIPREPLEVSSHCPRNLS